MVAELRVGRPGGFEGETRLNRWPRPVGQKRRITFAMSVTDQTPSVGSLGFNVDWTPADPVEHLYLKPLKSYHLPLISKASRLPATHPSRYFLIRPALVTTIQWRRRPYQLATSTGRALP